MKKLSYLLSVIVLFVVTLAFRPADPKAVQSYKVDTQKSKITWVGKKVTGEHNGNVKISQGNFNVVNNQVKDGSFEIDLSSLTVNDITDPAGNEKLVNHLKGDDFFATAKYPTAKFVITSVTPVSKEQYTVNGNLTIKGITHPISFPATITQKNNSIVANGDIVVDRTKYDIKFKSANYFENLGDKAISDEFTLKVNAVAFPSNL